MTIYRIIMLGKEDEGAKALTLRLVAPQQVTASNYRDSDSLPIFSKSLLSTPILIRQQDGHYIACPFFDNHKKLADCLGPLSNHNNKFLANDPGPQKDIALYCISLSSHIDFEKIVSEIKELRNTPGGGEIPLLLIARPSDGEEATADDRNKLHEIFSTLNTKLIAQRFHGFSAYCSISASDNDDQIDQFFNWACGARVVPPSQVLTDTIDRLSLASPLYEVLKKAAGSIEQLHPSRAQYFKLSEQVAILVSKLDNDPAAAISAFVTECNRIMLTKQHPLANKDPVAASAIAIALTFFVVGLGIGLVAGLWVGYISVLACLVTGLTTALVGTAYHAKREHGFFKPLPAEPVIPPNIIEDIDKITAAACSNVR